MHNLTLMIVIVGDWGTREWSIDFPTDDVCLFWRHHDKTDDIQSSKIQCPYLMVKLYF